MMKSDRQAAQHADRHMDRNREKEKKWHGNPSCYGENEVSPMPKENLMGLRRKERDEITFPSHQDLAGAREAINGSC